jgi:formylglycine-generating enzyme required for sulfatase activity
MKPFLTLLFLVHLSALAQDRMSTVTLPKGTERRVALVVGNRDYQHEQPLKNPLNDADDMARVLGQMGFAVTVLKNADYRTLGSGITDFVSKLTKSDVALFYFSGHGIGYQGQNYLMPVDGRITCMERIPNEALSLEKILSGFEDQKVRNSFVFLDACRSLPKYPGCYDQSRNSAGPQGLTIPTNNPQGSFIAFATAEGRTADDNQQERNGLFTSELLKHIAKPNLGIRTIMDQVTGGVRQRSGNKQQPKRYEDLEGDFYFLVSKTPSPPVDSVVITPTKPTTDFLVGPAMVMVKGGTFQMGSNQYDDEGPVHPMKVSDFLMGKYEVTVTEYMQFVAETNSHYPQWLEAGSECNIETGTFSYYKDIGYTSRQSQLPIVGVSWDDAVAYCDWLSTKNKRKYRLPTEAEWEYAARGGQSSRGYTHAGGNNADSVGWSDANSGGKPHNVGGKAANELGLFDLSGNVWERCSDWLGAYSRNAQTNPTGPATPQKFRVIRGGSWNLDPLNCRSTLRSGITPTSRTNYIGFRVVSQAQ